MALMPHPRRQDRARSGGVTALDSLPIDPRLTRSYSLSRPGAPPDSRAPWDSSPLDLILSEFTERWERGEGPAIEAFLDRLGSAPASDAVELIYHAYCLAESAGLNPDRAAYVDRFPAQARALERLFGLDRAFDASQLQLWADPATLPEVGDEIGPFLLLRELGEGGFARVFLAEQSDLDRRLVVVKVSGRITPEPRLLARARHSHIVEVLWHSLIDDGAFQLICMPFLGGATLADILAERRRRGERPRSGRDLLKELDRVSAPEYPAADLSRPARKIIAGLSYPKAVAQVVARLAEALHHAYSRGVLHGDVKPSNVLLTADGTPMLLDFNLAVGWRLAGGDDLPGDGGGTLAYMAPERLRALARPEDAAVPSAADRHRADIYALGMVLLEALAGRTPDHPRGSPPSPRELAAAFALSRQQGGAMLIRSCRVAIAPALHSIVTRCLAPDPADRYKLASELAEDLDRWCGDRPLAFAREPQWRFGLLRRARRRRLAVAAAALSLFVGAACTFAAWRAADVPLREKAQGTLSRLWDDVESKVFRFGQFGHWRSDESDAPEDAFHHLAYYKVLGDGDWRESDEVRALPESERLELEIWLLEQSLRLGRALRQRPDSPEDWRRGLEALERVVALRPLRPLESQCRLLRLRLGLPEPSTPIAPAPGADPPPPWMEEYLLGVEAEPLRAEEARAHYENVLRQRPGSFWGHYRLATLAYRLHKPDIAADHLEVCIALRPENPALRGQLAACLHDLHRFDAALEQCDKALALNPDFAESYRTRAFIRGQLRQGEGLKTDIRRFELLTRRLGKAPSWRLRLDWMLAQGSAGPGMLDRVFDETDLPQRLLTADPEDVDLRTALAEHLRVTGHPDLALAEFDKVLEINPDHLRARCLRGGLLYALRRVEADGDLSYLLEHPRFDELIQQDDKALLAFHYDSWALLSKGEVEKALLVAGRGLAYANLFKRMQGKSHYVLARINAASARSNPERLEQAVTHLWSAFEFHPDYLRKWYGQDPLFDDQRGYIDRLIREFHPDFD
jgi:serine/threonine protein kinase/Flp pilus assembly protein TadD